MTCDEFIKNIADGASELVRKSSSPENKEVRCDDYQVIVTFQAVEQSDGTYEVKIACRKLIPEQSKSSEKKKKMFIKCALKCKLK